MNLYLVCFPVWIHADLPGGCLDCNLRLKVHFEEDTHIQNSQTQVATSLVAGGETGVFSPMHLLVFEKPAEKPKAEKKPTVQKPSVGQ